MTRSSHRRSGRALVTLTIVAGIVIAGVFVVLTSRTTRRESDSTILLHKVERGDFEAFVTEPGDVLSSSNVEVRCLVESRGTPGSAILKICEEGTHVVKGDFLVQFDDSALQNEAIAQKIVVANDKALLIQANSDLANAERTLTEYVDGLFQQECEVLESAIFVAEEDLRKGGLALASSKRLQARGLITGLQVTADEFAVEKAKKDVAAASRALDVYKRFTREKMVGEFEAEIEKQKANVEAATFTLELSKQKLSDIEEQIANCYITAPAEGQVVHANQRDRGDPEVIEEGTLIRYNQVVIQLPDIRNMQVDAKVNESHVNRIKPGQPVQIELDADPDNVLHGIVESVAPYPFPIRWHGSPMEFGVEIAINDPPPTIRPGLRAKVHIYFESQPDVLQVPLAAIIAHNEQHYCLLQAGDAWRVQAVEIGPNNNNQVVVTEGLDEGDQVALTPFRHIERADLPDSKPSSLVAKKPSKVSDKLSVSGGATSATPSGS
jgi:RND family efflux transporter MFP subunit